MLTELANRIKTWVNGKLANKQDVLVSGTNIKTIDNTSLLGSGNISLIGAGGPNVYTFVTQSNLAINGANGNFFIVSSNGVNLSFTFSNIEIGQEYHYLIKNTSTSVGMSVLIPANAIAPWDTVNIGYLASENLVQLSMLDNGTNKIFYITELMQVL